VKHRLALYFVAFVLFGFLFAVDDVTAQTIAYRQTNPDLERAERGQQSFAVTGQSLRACVSLRPTLLHCRQQGLAM